MYVHVDNMIASSSPLPEESQLLPQFHVAFGLKVKLFNKEKKREFILFLFYLFYFNVLIHILNKQSIIKYIFIFNL